MKKQKQKKKKRKKKKKVRKIFITTVAFFSAAVVVVFCIYHMYFKTDLFILKGIDISSNSVYDENYIKEKIKIELGQKIFDINREEIKKTLEEEIYIKNVKVIYELPDRIYIEINQREESFQVIYNGQYIVIDDDGVVLNVYNEKSQLLTVESSVGVIYIIGEAIKFEGTENISDMIKLAEYCYTEMPKDTIKKLTVMGDDVVMVDTEYGTKVKVDLTNDVEYQLSFAIDIITERLNKNQSVKEGLIDFTKADSPLYIEGFQMEVEE